MSDSQSKALLPAGMRDILPPAADQAADVVGKLRAAFARWGYRWVNPPLIEFEDTLLDGAGSAMSGDTFRLMDPESQQMMGIRADITLQIARIAATRLGNSPRPLRLSYCGDVLRVRGSQLRPERQFTQIGAELIGTPNSAADAEVVLMAAGALEGLGVTKLSVDLNFPTLVPTVCEALSIDFAEQLALRSALKRKDASAVGASTAKSNVFVALLGATGPVEDALRALEAIDLPTGARGEAERLAEIATLIREGDPDLALTVDPVEFRGFEYHTGLSFTIYRDGVRGEMGSGGRYLAGLDIDGRPIETATGFTLYLDTILRALPEPDEVARLYLPPGTQYAEAARLRREGWVAIDGFNGSAEDADGAARNLGCTHILRNGAPVALSDD